MIAQDTKEGRGLVIFLLAWAVIFGALARLFPLMGGEMPVNDGALFYVMAQDIRQAGFTLPESTSFNQAGIPLAYPPLGFYLAALASFFAPLLQIVRWLPPIVSVLTIPAFFGLGRAVLKSEIQAALGSVAFALLPASYDLLIAGGGLTRAFGLLFSVLTLWSAALLFEKPNRRHLILTAIAGSLLVLSHPIATVHTILAAAVMWFFVGRNRAGLRAALLAALLILGLTAPWWGWMLHRHGWMPYGYAMHSGVDNWVFWLDLLRLTLGKEAFLDLIALLGLLGMGVCLVRRKFWLPVWLLVIFLVGRDALTATAIPLALAASLGLSEVILPGILGVAAKIGEQQSRATLAPGRLAQMFTASGGVRLILSFFLIYAVFNALAASLQWMSLRVTAQERVALAWVAENTPAPAQFLVLTYGDPLNTPLQEWFPALTGRVNLSVAQGYEWLPGQQFARRLADYRQLQPCLTQDWRCVETWAATHGAAYDYVYVYRGYPGREWVEETEPALSGWLIDSLLAAPAYELVYETDLISIFAYHGE